VTSTLAAITPANQWLPINSLSDTRANDGR
jgi:hypothetical protein